MNMWTVYLLLKLPAFGTFLLVCGTVALIGLVLLWVETDSKRSLKFTPLAAIVLIIGLLVPTKEDIAIMYAIPAVTDSSVPADAKEVYGLLLDRLKDELKGKDKDK